ncbi:MAG: restriction endonuclease subunit S [Bacteroidales bacterium]|nr:restriction endonuclease subunit S [Bacteroidales bacterium]
MEKYNNYKDSGIEWIGEIPEHWNLNKVKHNFSFKTGFTPPSGKTEYYEDGKHIWINISDLQEKEIYDSVNKITDKAIEDYKPNVVPKGSLLYSFKLSVGRVGFNMVDCYTNEAIFSIDPNSSTNLNFFYYSLPEQIIKNANENIYGAKILNQELIKNAFLVVPTPEEQTAIATYLDRKTAEIDELIADKKRLLELYEEEKTAIINELVTGKKVWNGNAWTEPVEIKDSGIEWLGEIPEHWEVKKLKHVAILKSGNSIVSEQIKESGEYPVYGGNGLRGYFSEFTHDGSHVLIGRQGAYCGNIKYGYSKFWASEHAVVVSPTVDYEIVYLGELLRTMNLGQYSVSAAQPGLAVDMIKNLFIPFPSRNEQQSIVRHIETECARIDAKKSKTEKLIDLLTEYRTALISEVVTGKIKVI